MYESQRKDGKKAVHAGIGPKLLFYKPEVKR